LREMAEALAALTAERPLVLLLEDLHWSDASTLDLIAAIVAADGTGPATGNRHVPAGRGVGRRSSAARIQAGARAARSLSRAAAQASQRTGGGRLSGSAL